MLQRSFVHDRTAPRLSVCNRGSLRAYTCGPRFFVRRTVTKCWAAPERISQALVFVRHEALANGSHLYVFGTEQEAAEEEAKKTAAQAAVREAEESAVREREEEEQRKLAATVAEKKPELPEVEETAVKAETEEKEDDPHETEPLLAAKAEPAAEPLAAAEPLLLVSEKPSQEEHAPATAEADKSSAVPVAETKSSAKPRSRKASKARSQPVPISVPEVPFTLPSIPAFDSFEEDSRELVGAGSKAGSGRALVVAAAIKVSSGKPISECKVGELKTLCKQHGIKGYSGKKWQQLHDTLLEAGVTHDA